MTYWPWWLGALAFGTITAGYAIWTGRSLGVSGAWSRVLTWREAREVDRLDELAAGLDLREVLAAATAEQFGSPARVGAGPGGWTGADGGGPPYAGTAAAEAPSREARHRPEPPPVRRPLSPVFGATLLVSVFLGGLIASLTSGRFEWRADMGEGYRQIVTGNPVLMVLLLFVGGVLVGFGTRMAGGCTSGHGLTGCSRLQTTSLAATAVFFGAAVVASFLLWKVI